MRVFNEQVETMNSRRAKPPATFCKTNTWCPRAHDARRRWYGRIVRRFSGCCTTGCFSARPVHFRARGHIGRSTRLLASCCPGIHGAFGVAMGGCSGCRGVIQSIGCRGIRSVSCVAWPARRWTDVPRADCNTTIGDPSSW